MSDLISYLDEEGYLDMRNQPIHALAILHFAEYFQCKPLYIDAFTHCTGMSDQLFLVPEYQVRLYSVFFTPPFILCSQNMTVRFTNCEYRSSPRSHANSYDKVKPRWT